MKTPSVKSLYIPKVFDNVAPRSILAAVRHLIAQISSSLDVGRQERCNTLGGLYHTLSNNAILQVTQFRHDVHIK